MRTYPDKIENIEIHPVIGVDEDGNPVGKYEDATYFEQLDDENDPNILAWGVYIHVLGKGLDCLFDVVDKRNAEYAAELLEKLFNTEYYKQQNQH